MNYVHTTAVAAHLRTQLKTAYPDVNFSVRSKPSAWIDVTWTDGPDENQVQALAAPLRGSRWDTYSQKYIQAKQLTVNTKKDGPLTGEPLVEGFHVRREYSAETLAKATEVWLTNNRGADIEAARHNWQAPMYVAGQDIRSGPVDAQLREIAAKVVLAN